MASTQNPNGVAMSSLPASTPQQTHQSQPASTRHHESQSPPSPPKIRILTLNVWGLKHLSHEHTARISAIAQLICHPTPTSSASASSFSSSPHPPEPPAPPPPPPPPPDIVTLQELWTYSDYLLLRRLSHAVLPYGKFYHSGCFGGGLVILSRWPLVASRMVRYRLNGRPSAFWRGDWFVGKGVACATIRLPAPPASGRRSAHHLEVFNTHLHAPYDEGGGRGKDTYSCHRVAQAWEVGGLMRRALERGSLVVGCGDFNMLAGGLEYGVLMARTGGLVRDVWRELHPGSSVGAWVDGCEKDRLKGMGLEGKGPPTVRESLGTHGHTCDSVLNTWRWEKGEQRDLLRRGRDRVVGLAEEDPRAKRLDYVFWGDGSARASVSGAGTGMGMGQGQPGWAVESARVCMAERHPELKCSLSDHFGVEAEIVWRAPPTAPPPSPSRGSGEKEEEKAETIAQHHRHQSPDDRPPPSNPYTPILPLIRAYTARSRLHRSRRCVHFLLSVLTSLSCFVAVWFSPANYVSFLLVLLASLGLMAGTVDGLIGLLFGGWELRALKEWEWEVRNEIRLEAEEEEEEEEEEWGRVKDWWD